VLFSITKSDERGDINLLPVYQSYKKILEELKVSEVSQDQKDKIKDMLRVLNIDMRMSPDLTETQAMSLIEKYIDDVSKMIEPKFNFGAAAKTQPDNWDKLDAKIAAI
jgi:hypothetical protein